jgi:hypothetical protein
VGFPRFVCKTTSPLNNGLSTTLTKRLLVRQTRRSQSRPKGLAALPTRHCFDESMPVTLRRHVAPTDTVDCRHIAHGAVTSVNHTGHECEQMNTSPEMRSRNRSPVIYDSILCENTCPNKISHDLPDNWKASSTHTDELNKSTTEPRQHKPDPRDTLAHKPNMTNSAN